VRPARGLYQLPEPPRHAAHTLAEAAVLVTEGSYLPYFGSSVSRVDSPGAVCRLDGDRAHCLATDNRISANPIRPLFAVSADRGCRATPNREVEVPITMPPRTVVDCFRYRNKIGLDVALEGLREGLRRRRFKPDDLWRYARKARVWSIMQPYIEAMVAQ
jgi:hypothetical protein